MVPQAGHATISAPAWITLAKWYEQNTGINMSQPETSTGQGNIPTRVIYRPESYTEPIPIPQKAGTRSHRITVVALFPEPLQETRDPTFAHNVAVKVP
ncbi:hypothetical protein CUMW_211860 [Citrus unshiu]|uniref:Uncharacterized protein n=1 Tax=Citrus unshiu TaxID=55188 RepID=A0A2H5QAS2_CITUN|nr:hypothetical protein CUMW_211860 [Citrus unshiu]